MSKLSFIRGSIHFILQLLCILGLFLFLIVCSAVGFTVEAAERGFTVGTVQIYHFFFCVVTDFKVLRTLSVLRREHAKGGNKYIKTWPVHSDVRECKLS